MSSRLRQPRTPQWRAASRPAVLCWMSEAPGEAAVKDAKEKSNATAAKSSQNATTTAAPKANTTTKVPENPARLLAKALSDAGSEASSRRFTRMPYAGSEPARGGRFTRTPYAGSEPARGGRFTRTPCETGNAVEPFQADDPRPKPEPAPPARRRRTPVEEPGNEVAPPQVERSSAKPDASVPASFNKSFRSQYAGQTQMANQTTPQQHISFYTDGSGSSGRATKSSLAGWGFVGYFRSSVIVESFGHVNVDEQSPFFLGARVASNSAGELSAIMEVLLYLAHPTSQYGTATIHYDSKWAADMTKGTARPKRNKRMVNLARLLLHKVQQKI